MQQFFRVNACTHGSRRNRGIEQVCERREHPYIEKSRQSTIGRITRMQSGRKPTLGGDEIHKVFHPVSQGVIRSILACQFSRRIRAGIYTALKHRLDEIRPLRKMAVYRTQADARSFRDCTDRCIHARLSKDLLGRLQEGAQFTLRVGTQGPSR